MMAIGFAYLCIGVLIACFIPRGPLTGPQRPWVVLFAICILFGACLVAASLFTFLWRVMP